MTDHPQSSNRPATTGRNCCVALEAEYAAVVGEQCAVVGVSTKAPRASQVVLVVELFHTILTYDCSVAFGTVDAVVEEPEVAGRRLSNPLRDQQNSFAIQRVFDMPSFG